jgi:hypothetical protein
MEGELWKGFYRLLYEVGKNYRGSKVQYSNRLIALVFFWAVLHDRPISWACRRESWPPSEQWRQWPSPAPMSRRLRTISFSILLTALLLELRARQPAHWVKTVDAKPLPVGGFSKDRDARWGWAANHKAKGYKLFAICNGPDALDTWRLGHMNDSEPVQAARLIPELPPAGYLLGDSLYDINHLYETSATHQWQLVAPRKKPQAGLGRRRHSPHRLRSLALLATPFGQALYQERTSMERFFGQWGNFGGGLGPLPNWVRTPPRVANWVAAKLVLNALRITRKSTLVA